jgi:type IV fimbrial biogenesis protein FimT
MKSLQGVTLIELMITVAILSVLIGLAVPTFDSVRLSSKLRSYSNELVAGALLARSEAIKRNSVVKLCVMNADGDDCQNSTDWENGWLIFHDANNDDTLDAGETLIAVHPAATTGYKLDGSAAVLAFEGDGVGSTTFTMTVCRATPSVGDQERMITVSASGTTNVTKTTNASCP